eukprot:scaffold9068_cov38-Cyclotella_meneghiniana.AAC.2
MRTGFRIRKKSAGLAYFDQELRETGLQNLKASWVLICFDPGNLVELFSEGATEARRKNNLEVKQSCPLPLL